MNPDAGLPVVGFDLDGTLFWNRASTAAAFRDPRLLAQACYPRRDAIYQFQKAMCVPVVITGRAERVREVTEDQFYRFTRLRSVPIYCQEEWRGRDALVRYKADSMRVAGCHGYVGDSPEDAEAAAQAGVPFLHADRFARWGLSPLLPLLEPEVVA